MAAVTLADLKAHLRITVDDDDAVIAAKLAAATDWVANYTGIADAESFPPAANEAVRRIAADLYENREASIVGISAQTLPFGVLDLLVNERRWVF